jgi:hypothetical protein
MADSPNNPEQPGSGTPQPQPAKDGKTDAKPGQPDPAKDGNTDAKAGTAAGTSGPPKGGSSGDNDDPPTVPPEPPLDRSQKIWAGVLIIGAILLSLSVIIAHWPDKMPTSANNTTYCYKFMHVTLLDQSASPAVKEADKAPGSPGAPTDPAKTAVDSIKLKAEAEIKARAAEEKAKAEKAAAEKAAAAKKDPCAKTPASCHCTIQYGALILILVAAAGFLGNMVFVASSFATFVGAGKFRRSWILWYFVKPFTASGLATVLYLALNNSNAGPGTSGGPVNLNGIIATAALAGLFTDIATQKLKEIFTAIFKPADNRPDKLTDPSTKVISVDLTTMHPDKIDVAGSNQFLITGQNLDPKNLIVTILKKKIDPVSVTPTLIKFDYKVDDTDKAVTKFPLLITDAQGIKIGAKDMGV